MNNRGKFLPLVKENNGKKQENSFHTDRYDGHYEHKETADLFKVEVANSITETPANRDNTGYIYTPFETVSKVPKANMLIEERTISHVDTSQGYYELENQQMEDFFTFFEGTFFTLNLTV